MAPGLSDEQITQLRDEVAAGKSPRVRISGSQFGAAGSGAVRAVGDPAVDGTDYVTVRIKINGVTDDLRFAPRELSRGRKEPVTRPRTAAAPPAKRTATAGRSRATGAPPAAPAAAPVTRRPGPSARGSGSSSSAANPVAVTSVAWRPAAGTTAPKRGARKAAPGASVTITLKSSGTSWTISAQRGAKSVAKNVAVNPGVVSAVAGLIGVPSLEDAVATVNDTARIEAELRAEELRAELARIQAVLDSHRLP